MLFALVYEIYTIKPQIIKWKSYLIYSHIFESLKVRSLVLKCFRNTRLWIDGQSEERKLVSSLPIAVLRRELSVNGPTKGVGIISYTHVLAGLEF
jgi:hypothetical protein